MYFSQAHVVSYEAIWDSLSMVPECDAMIGVDSSMKTMASMLRIPTMTLVGDYAEPFRDTHFILPYVRAGVMRTMRCTKLTAVEAKMAAAEFRTLLGLS